ncbi:MAG: hypothetical protein WKF79_08560 [Nocardioides sp.]
MVSRVRGVLAIAACVALSVGCTADPLAETEPERAGAEAQAGLAALWAGDDATAEDQVAGCFAEEFAARTTTAQLVQADIVDASGAVAVELPLLDAEMAALWVDAQIACVDYVEESTRALVAQSKGTIDRTAYADCLRGDLTEDDLRSALVASLTGQVDSPDIDVLSEAQLACARVALPAE